jgi:hypothetical protein
MEDQETLEQSSPLPSTSQPDNQKPCRYCRKPIHKDAKVCHHCRFHQSRFIQYFVSYGVLAALLALGISVFQLNEARNERIDASEAKRDARIAVEQVQAAETKVEALVAQAQTAEQHIREIEERQILRTFINILPNGDELLYPVTVATWGEGKPLETIGRSWPQGAPFKSVKGSQWEWTCDDKTIMQLSYLIQKLRYIPYAYVARADCFKKRGVSSWQDDAEHAKNLLEKMRTIEPHPKEIDDFYATCLSLLQPPE